MKIRISSDAEADLADGYWFYEDQESGLGARFRASVKSDILSLEKHGGTHSRRHGHHRLICKTFPFAVYYQIDSSNSLTVVAVLGQRRNPKWIRKRLGGDAK